jgi:hypothetical protein
LLQYQEIAAILSTMRSHFELAVQKAMTECAQTSLAVSLGDSHKHAYVKGFHDGLQKSLEIYRTAARADVDDEAA